MPVRAPPRAIVKALRYELNDFVNRLNVVYRDQPFGVTSWWRSWSDNQRISGAALYSQHLVGLAIDCYPLAGTFGGLDRHARDQGLIVVPYQTHLHFQYWPAGTLQRLLGA